MAHEPLAIPADEFTVGYMPEPTEVNGLVHSRKQHLTYALERYSGVTITTELGDNSTMIVGERLRELREAKQLSQGDIEKRTGLAKVECGERRSVGPVGASGPLLI